jgi:hypothetical protein
MQRNSWRLGKQCQFLREGKQEYARSGEASSNEADREELDAEVLDASRE